MVLFGFWAKRIVWVQYYLDFGQKELYGYSIIPKKWY
jgi:hypothetical protein